jgi:hypothetical protein
MWYDELTRYCIVRISRYRFRNNGRIFGTTLRDLLYEGFLLTGFLYFGVR